MSLSLKYSILVLILLSGFLSVFAQPLNDDCVGAFQIILANSEANAVAVAGDTRGATASMEPLSVCSGSWYTDDIWFKFTTPADVPENGLIIRVYFNNAITPTDVPAIGMAVYESCDLDETPLRCFSSDVPEDNNIEIAGACLQGDHEYVVRVWSTGNTADTEGTFSIAAYINSDAEDPLWWETFAGGLEANGWTTEGTCAVADSNDNAGWTYRPEGLVDKGAWIFDGAAINSPTLCDGAVGVDSDYDDTGGIEGNAGNGPCPAPAQHILISPEIDMSEWNFIELAIEWTQALRQYASTYYFSYKVKDSTGWSKWEYIEINTEFELNSNFISENVQRLFLSSAIGKSQIQFRFIYNADYYNWVIDDIKLIGMEFNNGKIAGTPAIAPWALIPIDQIRPFSSLVSIANNGTFPLEEVEVSHIIKSTDTQEEVYTMTKPLPDIPIGDSINNIFFEDFVDVSPFNAYDFEGEYKLKTKDKDDFDSDNSFTYSFHCGGHTFSLEDGYTRSISVASSIYDDGAPLSYAYGIFYRPKLTTKLKYLYWGVNNPKDMAGQVVNLYLLQWTDDNNDLICQGNERKYIAFGEYQFSGEEEANTIIQSTLMDFNQPGNPIVMAGGLGYIAIVEYQAIDEDAPQFFMLASEARDYSGAVAASDSAVAQGLAEHPAFFSVLGFSPDGNIAHIDYEVREFDVNDNRIFFGHDIVPVIRITTVHQDTINTHDILPLGNNVTTFPNPASDIVNVKLEFSQPYSEVKLRLIDNLGRVVYYNELENTITSHIEPITVSDMPSGNYLLQVETIDGQRSVPVIVVK